VTPGQAQNAPAEPWSGRFASGAAGWPGQSVEVYRNGTDTGTVSGTEITIATSVGGTLDLAPAGTPLATVTTELGQTPASDTTTSSSFSTGFESGQPAPTWTDTVDTTGGGDNNVTALCCGVSGPEAGVRTGETSHTGSSSLMYSGSADGSDPHAYTKVFDLSGSPLAIGSGKTLSYWSYPQSSATTPYVPAGSDDSSCVAIDLVFTDDSTLRDSGAVDQNGNRIHPADQCGHLTLDAWNHVTVDLGTDNADKEISRILVGYDQPGGSGGYRGYIDDISIG
jgi:alpha-L-fucosidase 2